MMLAKWKATFAILALTVGFGGSLPDRWLPPVQQQGRATTYGLGGLHGDTMANGQPFEPMKEITCAHKELPLGSVVYVESVETGRIIPCPITDRGPYAVETSEGKIKAVDAYYEAKPGETWVRILDMSVRACKALGEWGLFRVRIRYWSTGYE